MTVNDLERLVSELKKNAVLSGEFNALDADPGAWVRWAGAKGYQLSRDEAATLAEYRDSEISDDDLEKVAGGWCGNETTTS